MKSSKKKSNRSYPMTPELYELTNTISSSFNSLKSFLDASIFAYPDCGVKVGDAKEILTDAFETIGIQLGSVDTEFVGDEIAIVAEVMSCVVPGGGKEYFRRKIASHYELYKHEFSRPVNKLPLAVELLIKNGNRVDISLADMTRHIFLSYANAVVKADGTVSQAEQEALAHFESLLMGFRPAKSHPKQSEPARAATADKTEAVIQHDDHTYEELIKELNSLVGLKGVKEEVVRVTNLLRVQQMRKDQGLATATTSRHLVFLGNPGTGKTTIARILSQIYRSLGILSKGHLVETDRSGLVAAYVGQTALKVKDVVEKSVGGVLFIDEAYSLWSPGDNDYGQEAIATLVKLMEDYRTDLIVIIAGYTDRMEKFLSSNPGLKSRFNKYFNFVDYTPTELLEIFELFCSRADYALNSEAKKSLKALLEELHSSRDQSFGNARVARNLFESSIENLASRVVSIPKVNKKILSTIMSSDITR